MPKRSNEFQRLLLLITHAVGGTARIQESAMLTDKLTAEQREVDILITAEAAGYPVLIAVEVTDRSRPADVLWVEQQYTKHAHLPTDKLVLVSRGGFTPQARLKAQGLKIEVADYEEALDVDWQFATSLLSGGTFELLSAEYQCDVVLEQNGNQVRRERVNHSATVYLPYRETPTTIDLMVRYFLDEPRIRPVLVEHAPADGSMQTYQVRYRAQPGTYVLDDQANRFELLELLVDLKYKRRSTPTLSRVHATGTRRSASVVRQTRPACCTLRLSGRKTAASKGA